MSVSGDVVFFGLDKDDKPVILKADTELFYNSFKYIEDFKASLRHNCPRVWKFLSRFFEDAKTPNGLSEQIPDYASVTGIYDVEALNNLVRQIQLVLFDASFQEELDRKYDEWDECVAYRDELLEYYKQFLKVSCTIGLYLRLLEIRDAHNKDFIDNVPKFLLDSKVTADTMFYVVLFNA